jgi:hypothetical protein
MKPYYSVLFLETASHVEVTASSGDGNSMVTGGVT